MKKANLSYKIFSKTFKNKISKQAYLEATKWLAINIFSKKQLSESLSISINKVKDNAFEVTIFLNTNEDDLKNKFCEKCKDVYTTFYQVEKMDCNNCKMRAYRKTNEKYVENMCNFYEKIFAGIEDEEEN